MALDTDDPGLEEGESGAGRMTLVEHLTELRRRLIISAIAVAVGACVAFALYNPILAFLSGPYHSITHGQKLIVTDPLEAFATRLKIAAWGGLFFASPVVLWQLWRFITPGLNPKEKRYAIPFIIASILLFMMGAAVALLTLKPALQFLQSVGGHNLATYYRAGPYLSLVMLMIVAFGVAFEFPILLVFLELAGVLPSARLRKWRRPAIVIIVTVAAVITPSQDPYSLFAMAIPMYIFYEASILIGRILKK
ncbi:MAG TPA: twin-arginine translocase subunit TatC [Acidimicrobiales bacterium]|nr:twin-arginine translocase subunit TatC [Acidimicrobiales bacterium]